MNPILGRVRRVIRETGKTQRALAEDGVAPQQVLSRWMTVDEAEPSATSLANFCEKLHVNGHWVLTGKGEIYTLSGGADTLVEQGVQIGLQRVEEMVRVLRATSRGAGNTPLPKDAEPPFTVAEAMRAAVDAVEALGTEEQTPPAPGKKPKPRRAASHPK